MDRLTPGRRRHELGTWLAMDLAERFAGRILAIDAPVAQRWGALRASAARGGRTLPVVDSLIVATALEYGLAVVTRNVRDLAGLGVSVFNPWNV